MLQEVEMTADDVVIIANGRLVKQGSMDELRGEESVLVRTTQPEELARALLAAGMESALDGPGVLSVRTGDLVRVGDTALRAGLPVHELRPLATDLEALFFALTDLPENRNRNLGVGAGGRDG